MEQTHGYRGKSNRFEGVIVVMLVAAWSISTMVLVGLQNSGAVA